MVQPGAGATIAERKIDPGYQGVFEKRYTDAVRGDDGRRLCRCGRDRHRGALRGGGRARPAQGQRGPGLAHHGSGLACRHRAQWLEAAADGQQARQLQRRPRAVRRAHHAEVYGRYHRACRGPGRPRSTRSSRSRTRTASRCMEDCAQAHFAKRAARPVGTFGDIAAFSTMYRKAHMTGPVRRTRLCPDLEIFRRALAHADRGKPRWREDFERSRTRPPICSRRLITTPTRSLARSASPRSRACRQTIIARQAFVSDFVARLVRRLRMCASPIVSCRPARRSSIR